MRQVIYVNERVVWRLAFKEIKVKIYKPLGLLGLVKLIYMYFIYLCIIILIILLSLRNFITGNG